MDEIANYRYFLQVLERDMKEIKENYMGQIDVIKEDIKEKLKSFRENVSGADNGGADIVSKNNKECLQDIAVMGEKISPHKSTMEYELGIRDGLHMRTKREPCGRHARTIDECTMTIMNEQFDRSTPSLPIAETTVNDSVSFFPNVNDW